MQPRNFYGKQVYKLWLPPNYDSDDSCLSDIDNEYLPSPKRSLCPSDSSSDEESNGSDGQPFTCALVENEVNANSKVSVKSGVLGLSNQTASRRIIWKSIAANANAILPPSWKCSLPESADIRNPFQYFQQFFDKELLDHIVEQSNLYALQADPSKPLLLRRLELEQFLGTVLYNRILRLHRSRMYWAAETRVSNVVNIMERGRWELTKKHLHFNDNSLIFEQDPANPNRLFKIQPVIDHLVSKFQSIPQQQVLGCDEQMIPFKGHSALKQYIPKNHTNEDTKYTCYVIQLEWFY